MKFRECFEKFFFFHHLFRTKQLDFSKDVGVGCRPRQRHAHPNGGGGPASTGTGRCYEARRYVL